MTTCASGAGVGATNTAPVHYQIAPNYHATYTEQAGASIERQLLAGVSVTLTYLHSFGIHQQVLRNANQAIGGTPQNSSQSYLYQYFPEAVFKQYQMIASFSARAAKNLSLSGFLPTPRQQATGLALMATMLFQTPMISIRIMDEPVLFCGMLHF